MSLENLYSFLTFPKKSVAPTGVEIPLDGSKLCLMLSNIFDNSDRDCNVPIAFTSDGGNQNNEVMSEFISFLITPSIASALPSAIRLQSVTTGSSGMGLLFLCAGISLNGKKKLVVARFPADEGIVADTGNDQLSVKFVDQVFLKNAHAYKAATYTWSGVANDLWMGHAVDKQVNHSSKSIADYWIVDFLKSDFSTSPALGTKRLANALKNAAQSTDSQIIKAEITSASNLANNLPHKSMSVSEFCDHFHFSNATKVAVLEKVDPARLIHEKFKFDSVEFRKHIAFKQIEFDTGAIISAPAEIFSECFTESTVGEKRTYSTTGKVVDQRLKRTK